MPFRASVSDTSRAVSSAEKTSVHVTAEHALEDRADQRVVRAAEDHRVDVCFLQRLAYSRTACSVCSPYGSSLSISGTRRGHATGNELDAGVERVHELGVASRVDGPLRREQPDAAVACRLHGRMHLRRQHPITGTVERLPAAAATRRRSPCCRRRRSASRPALRDRGRSRARTHAPQRAAAGRTGRRA